DARVTVEPIKPRMPAIRPPANRWPLRVRTSSGFLLARWSNSGPVSGHSSSSCNWTRSRFGLRPGLQHGRALGLEHVDHMPGATYAPNARDSRLANCPAASVRLSVAAVTEGASRWYVQIMHTDVCILTGKS